MIKTPLVLFDDPQISKNLLPFTFYRPIAKIRVGIFTIDKKWQFHSSTPVHFFTNEYVQSAYLKPNQEDNYIWVNAAYLPTNELIRAINSLDAGEALIKDKRCIAFRGRMNDFSNQNWNPISIGFDLEQILYPWDIFKLNGAQILQDFELILQHFGPSQPINDKHTAVYGKDAIYIAPGVTIKAACLDAENAPIFIGENAHIHAGAMIGSGHAIGEGAHINMGAKLKGDSTIGPYCKVGGEVSNSVFFGYSNKGHDGFVGNSVIAEWCNLGADTNTSNLKNNYGPVKVWNYAKQELMDTQLTFCGLLMGDHAKCGINTMFNTGTVVGVAANVFGSDFPDKFIPSFAWGGAHGWQTFDFNKCLDVAERVMQRRGKSLTEYDKIALQKTYEMTQKFRSWE